MTQPYPKVWIPRLGLVVVAYESDAEWRPYGMFSHIGPSTKDLHKEWRWCAVTLRTDGSVQIAYKPVGKHKWKVQS